MLRIIFALCVIPPAAALAVVAFGLCRSLGVPIPLAVTAGLVVGFDAGRTVIDRILG